MDPEKFDTWFVPGGSEPYAVDNAMLAAEASGSSASASAVAADPGSAAPSRTKPPPPPANYIDPETAISVMTNQPAPVTDIYDISTTCSESSTDDNDDVLSDVASDDSEDGLQRTLDELVGTSAETTQASRKRRRRKRKRSSHRMGCFGCAMSIAGTKGASDGQIEYTAIQSMQRMFNDLAPHTERWTVAHLLHTYYKNAIYKPLKAAWRPSDPKPVRWHTWEIYAHFWTHSKSPEVYVLNQLHEYEAMSRMLYLSCAAKTDGGTGAAPCEKTILTKLRVDAHIRTLRREPLEEHNFRQGEEGMDVHKAGAHFAPYRMFKRA